MLCLNQYFENITFISRLGYINYNDIIVDLLYLILYNMIRNRIAPISNAF